MSEPVGRCNGPDALLAGTGQPAPLDTHDLLSMRTLHRLCPFKKNLTLLAALVFGSAASASPLLRCEVTYAGSARVLEATSVTDPYPVPAVDIGGRFWFKPVMVGQGGKVDYVKLYAYLDTRQQPLLIQEAIYLPPFQTGDAPYSLTGTQHLYAGPVERELIYSCTLQGVQP